MRKRHKKHKRIQRRVFGRTVSGTNLAKVDLFCLNPSSYFTNIGSSIVHDFQHLGHVLKKDMHKLTSGAKNFARKTGHFFTSPGFKKGLQIFTLVATVALIGLMIASGVGVAGVGPLITGLMVMVSAVQIGEGAAAVHENPKDAQGWLNLSFGLLGVLGPVTEAASVAVESAEAAETAIEATNAVEGSEEFIQLTKAAKVSKTTEFLAGLKGPVSTLEQVYDATANTFYSIDDFKHKKYVDGLFHLFFVGLDAKGLGEDFSLIAKSSETSNVVKLISHAKSIIYVQSDIRQLITDIRTKHFEDVGIDVLNIGLDTAYAFNSNSKDKNTRDNADRFEKSKDFTFDAQNRLDELDFSEHAVQSSPQSGGRNDQDGNTSVRRSPSQGSSQNYPAMYNPNMENRRQRTTVSTFPKLRKKEPMVVFIRSTRTMSFISMKQDYQRRVVH